MKVFAVSNHKGGVGKTTLSFHLAFYLAGGGNEISFKKLVSQPDGSRKKEIVFKRKLKNKKVLFIDFDPQKNASYILQKYANGCSYDLLSENYTIAPQENSDRDITLLKADKRLIDLENFSANKHIPIIKNNIERASAFFDYVIVDCPPALNKLIRSVFFLSDYALAPIQLTKFSMLGITDLIKVIRGVQKYNPSFVFLGMIPNNMRGSVDKANAADEETVKRIKMQESILINLIKTFPQYLLSNKDTGMAVGIRYHESIETAVNSQYPVWELKKQSADALACSKEFFRVFDAIESQIGGF